MSVYFIKGKGYRYDFTLKGIRYTATWFKTKTEAKQAESIKREEVRNPKPVIQTSTDIAFLELVNRRLDYVKAYKYERYYTDYVYLAKRWVRKWTVKNCDDISSNMVQNHLYKRKKVSPYAANKDLRHIRSLFNYGIEKK